MEQKQHITRNRRYALHYKLRKKGNKVNTRQKMVTKRAIVVSTIEQKYLSELINVGYCICDDLFAS